MPTHDTFAGMQKTLMSMSRHHQPVIGWRFVTGHPALLLEGEGGTLVISDLHIGLEEELRRNGVYVPPITPMMLGELARIGEGTGATRLIVLGDIKHSIAGFTPFEMREIHNFFGGALRMFRDVLVVPGNHDGGIMKMGLGSVNISSTQGIRIDVGDFTVGLTHGHTRLPRHLIDVDLLLAGHHHLYVRGVSRYVEKYPVWVRTLRAESPKEIIIVPAFNRLLGGAALTGRIERSPVLSLALEDPRSAEVYTLDGYRLGTLDILEAGLLVEMED